MSSAIASGASRRRLLFLATLALVLAVAMHEWQPDPDAPAAAPVAAASDSASGRAPADTTREVRGDSAERAWVEETLQRWNREQRWMVAFATDSSAEFHEVVLGDSSARDVLEAFVHLPALRDSTATIELLGGPAPARARLAGPMDSVLRAAAEDQTGGCLFPPILRLRHAAGTPSWQRGFVPGMASFVAPTDTNAVAHRAEALRLFAALRDTTEDGAPADSLPTGPWGDPSLRSWRADGLEILVASRRRAIRGGDGVDHGGEERQLVIADREDGASTPFTRRFDWRARAWPDEESDAWVEAAMRVGPRRRFVFLMGYRGKEGGAGSVLARGEGEWREAVGWSWGC